MIHKAVLQKLTNNVSKILRTEAEHNFVKTLLYLKAGKNHNIIDLIAEKNFIPFKKQQALIYRYDALALHLKVFDSKA